jgi:ubiquinol-cytochrome c reductase iron-sulfur subunit
MANSANAATSTADGDEKSRRDFLLVATSTIGGLGVALAVWPLIHSMNPAKDTLALSTTEVDLTPIEEGQSITVVWQGKPVFVRHRTGDEIEQARSVDNDDLADPQSDEDRVQKAQWLIMVGVCTHLGCIPLGQKSSEPKGEYGGWFCPCHGSHYDTSGRIRKGPAPKNLAVPGYTFLDDTTIKIG